MLRMKLTIHYVNPPDVLKSKTAEAVRYALKEMGTFWWKTQLPGHFKRGAEMRYRYAQRGFKYLRRKQREKGHRDPLVWSGTTRQMMTTMSIVTASAKQGTVRMLAPRYFFVKGATLTREGRIAIHPDMVGEIQTMTGADVEKLETEFRDRFEEFLNKGRTERTEALAI